MAADGAASTVRKAIGQDFQGRTYGEEWLIVDAERPDRALDDIEFICDPRRPTPHMPAPGHRERWEFMLHKGESRDQMEQDGHRRALLAPYGDGQHMTIARKAVYRFHARTCERFSVGRVFLVGDAAHVTPPFIGQGLVAGLRDAANLSWKLAWVLRGSAGEGVLASYDTERRPHAKAMIDLARFMGHLIMPRSRIKAWLVHGTVRALRLLPYFRAYFDDLRIKPQNRFREGLFALRPRRSGAVPGSWLPQGLLRAGDGTIVLSDDVLGDRFVLLGCGVDPAAHLGEPTLRRWQAAGGAVVRVEPRGSESRGASAWEDLSDALVPGAALVGRVLVVRPDKTVMHDGPADECERLVRESLALLGAPDPPASMLQPAAQRRHETGAIAPMPKLSTPEPARHPDPTVRARRLAYLIWERPDLERAEAFLTAFGLQVAERTPTTLYLRGTAAAPYCYVVHKAAKPRFVGFALELASRDDLERIAKSVPGAGAIESLDGPGGGEVVRLTDPSGFRVEAVHGQQPYAAVPRRAPLTRFNTADASPRVDDTQRVPVGAPEVVKLGHVVLELADFQATCGWYTRHFGFIPSDVQVLPDGSPVVTFMRLDLGDTPADHHTLALAQGLVAGYSHSAFELVDADAVGMGQRDPARSAATATPGASAGTSSAARSSTTGRTRGATSTSTTATATYSPPAVPTGLPRGEPRGDGAVGPADAARLHAAEARTRNAARARTQPAPQPGPQHAQSSSSWRACSAEPGARPRHNQQHSIEDSAWPSTSFTTSTRVAAAWGVLRGTRVTPVPGEFATTGEFIGANGVGALASLRGGEIDLAAVRLLSPITRNQQFVCQGANYRQHMIESGMDPDAKHFNMIFTKARSCIVPADSDVVRPRQVKFLDYEIELGLVLRSRHHGQARGHRREPARVRRGHRDRQRLLRARRADPADAVLQGQELPHLRPGRAVPVPARAGRHASCSSGLRLTLTVNGEVRQDDSTANLVYGPAETLTELSGVQDFAPGDLIATGTPAGCALSIPSPVGAAHRDASAARSSAGACSSRCRRSAPSTSRAATSSRRGSGSEDGAIDLGVQRNRIVEEAA